MKGLSNQTTHTRYGGETLMVCYAEHLWYPFPGFCAHFVIAKWLIGRETRSATIITAFLEKANLCLICTAT